MLLNSLKTHTHGIEQLLQQPIQPTEPPPIDTLPPPADTLAPPADQMDQVASDASLDSKPRPKNQVIGKDIGKFAQDAWRTWGHKFLFRLKALDPVIMA